MEHYRRGSSVEAVVKNGLVQDFHADNYTLQSKGGFPIFLRRAFKLVIDCPPHLWHNKIIAIAVHLH